MRLISGQLHIGSGADRKTIPPGFAVVNLAGPRNRPPAYVRRMLSGYLEVWEPDDGVALRHYDAIVKFIAQHTGPVLVYCVGGISRSTQFVLRYTGMPLALLQSMWPRANPKWKGGDS